ncbi:MAG: type II toxin-antitoxin system VapC family toxin [Acidobacteriota bacterium]
MADCLLDSDVVIWHLRGDESVVPRVVALSRQGRIGLSVITRAEVIQGMREQEREGTFEFLDACKTLPVDRVVADRAGEIARSQRAQGRTIDLPDALIGATALEAEIPLYTCNPRHFPMTGLDLRTVVVNKATGKAKP